DTNTHNTLTGALTHTHTRRRTHQETAKCRVKDSSSLQAENKRQAQKTHIQELNHSYLISSYSFGENDSRRYWWGHATNCLQPWGHNHTKPGSSKAHYTQTRTHKIMIEWVYDMHVLTGVQKVLENICIHTSVNELLCL